MSQHFKIACRGSWLSLAQADIFRKRLLEFERDAQVELVIKETRGDADQDIPLDAIEGKDFFTKDIQDALRSGEADFAVHSLKDVSGEEFFDRSHYAIIERDDVHDIAIFNNVATAKLKAGIPLKIGTSSPRRAEMAIGFLRQTLPGNVRISAHNIRGNVDTRLRKLNDEQYDGIILACAGLNRLLRSPHSAEIAELLDDKHKLILPLMNCPPAPGQGAIVAETVPGNTSAVEVLKQIGDRELALSVQLERKIAHQFGSGCHQKFGVVHIRNGEERFIRAAGKDRREVDFDFNFSDESLSPIPGIKTEIPDPEDPFWREQNILLITSPLSGVAADIIGEMNDSRIWVAQTELWQGLARQGIWVEGSLEGFGFKFNELTINSPVLRPLHSSSSAAH